MSGPPRGRAERMRLMKESVDENTKPGRSSAGNTSRVNLPGFGSGQKQQHLLGSQPKKQQHKRLNTPTKAPLAATTPPTALAGSGAGRDTDRSRDVPAAAATTAADADDPYSFPCDPQEEEPAAARAAGKAASFAGKRQQQPAGANRSAAAAANLAAGRTTNRTASEVGKAQRRIATTCNASRQLFGDRDASGTIGGSSGLNIRQAGTASSAFAWPAATGSCIGGSAAGGAATGVVGGVVGRGTKQMGIKGFTVPQELLSPQYCGKLPAGMLNHGNTCYLNAVLQALLSLPCLARDLSNDSLQQLALPAEGVTMALQTCLRQHTASCSSSAGSERSGSSAISPAVVSAAMARLSSRWGSCRQEDAHEFLTALLDALQTEVLAAQMRQCKSINSSAACSVTAAPAAAAEAASPEALTAAVVAGTLPNQPCNTRFSEEEQPSKPAASGADQGADADTVLDAAGPHKAAAAVMRAPAASAAAQAAAAGPRLSVSAARCPASRNFSGCLQHTLTCRDCGYVTCVKEQFNHLSLDLPAAGGSSSGGDNSSTAGQQQQQQQERQQDANQLQWMLSGGIGREPSGRSVSNGNNNNNSNDPPVPELQSLLANFFAPEVLEKACEACGAAAAQHSLQHAVRRLPRVLVVHLKRFQWQVLAGGGAMCRKLATRVRPDPELHLGTVCCPGRPVPPQLAELMPPGLLQRAHAAMASPEDPADAAEQQQQHDTWQAAAAAAAGSGPVAGSKRSRADSAAGAAVSDGGLDAAVRHSGACNAGKQLKQQALGSYAASQAHNGQAPSNTRKPAGAAGGGTKSRFNGMQLGQQGQQGQRTKKVMSMAGPSFVGARHTDFSELSRAASDNPRINKRKLPPSFSGGGAGCADGGGDAAEPTVLSDGDDGDHDHFACGDGGMPRNNSSTQLNAVGLTGPDEDEQLQRVLAESIKTAVQEQQQRSGCKPDKPYSGTDMPDWIRDNRAAAGVDGAGAGCGGSSAGALWGAAGAGFDDDDDGDGFGADGGSPRTPRTSNGAAAGAAGRQPLQPLVPGTAGQEKLFNWAPDTAAATQQQRGEDSGDVGVGGLSGGAGGSEIAGLSGGLAALSDGGKAGASAGPASCQQPKQYGMPAHSLFSGLDRVSAPAATGGSLGGGRDCSPPRSPISKQPWSKYKQTKGVAGGSRSTLLLDGIEDMSEEEQMKRALEESLNDQGPVAAAAAAPAAAGGSSFAALAGIDKDSYDEDAALQAALAASAAEHCMQHKEQEQGGKQAGPRQQQEQQGSKGEAGLGGEQQKASGSEGGAGGGAVGGDEDDNSVVLVEETGGPAGASGSGVQQQQSAAPRLRLPLVRLVEDSDCEGDDAEGCSPASNAQQPADATAGHEAMQVELPEQQQQQPAAKPRAAAAADSAAQAAATAGSAGSGAAGECQMWLQGGKENLEEDLQLQKDGTAGSSAAAGGVQGSSKPRRQRKPLGEILGSRAAANVNNRRSNSSAAAAAEEEPPAKRPALAAAVAAASGAAAAAAAKDAGDELAATNARAAADAAGAWPQDMAAVYRLRAVVRHKGPLASSGHFVSDVMSNQQGGQWFHYDDSYVQATNLPSVVRRCEGDGYLFFYVNSAILDEQQQKKQGKML